MIAEILLFALISFSIAYVLLPFLIKSLLDKGFFGFDIHKLQKKKVSESGGIAVLFAFVTSLLLYIAFINFSNATLKVNLLAAAFSVIIAGLIGLVDDILALPWRVKILSAFIPALPLIAFKAGETNMLLPFFGAVEFGILYSLLLIPLMANFAINSYNMLAGLNGLESGMALISLATIITASIISGNLDVAIFASCAFGATFAFFLFNKYPSKVFPGDTGTFFWGAVLISCLIISNMEKLALGIFLLYFINFILLFIHIFKKCKNKFSKIDINEKLTPECWHTVYWVIPFFVKKLGEKDVVRILWAIQGVICVVSLILFF